MLWLWALRDASAKPFLGQMGRDEKEEKQGEKKQPWSDAGTVQGGDVDWRCWWPLLLPSGFGEVSQVR